MEVLRGEDVEAPAPPPVLDFEDVFRLHADRLVRLAGLLCGDAAQAEEAVAEVFARLYRRWRPGAIGDLDAYLRRAVVNEVAGEFRRRARVRARRVVGGPPSSQESGADEVGERDRVWRALLRLPARQRAVLVLRYFDDESEARVAEVLGLPLGTVKSTAARGGKALRRILEEEGDDAG